MRFLRSRHPSRLLVAERFVAPVARLSAVVLPLDVVARQPAARLRFVVCSAERLTRDHRAATLANPGFSPEESLRLEFAPFDAPAGSVFFVGVLALRGRRGAVRTGRGRSPGPPRRRRGTAGDRRSTAGAAGTLAAPAW